MFTLGGGVFTVGGGVFTVGGGVFKMQTGEGIQHSRELQVTEDQFHRRTREPEIKRLRDIRGEPKKRADHGRRSAMERSQVMAKTQEAGRREARSRSISHRRNLSTSWDRDLLPPPDSQSLHFILGVCALLIEYLTAK